MKVSCITSPGPQPGTERRTKRIAAAPSLLISPLSYREATRQLYFAAWLSLFFFVSIGERAGLCVYSNIDKLSHGIF